MFENLDQKGLFTFYWEQSHPALQPSQTLPPHCKSLTLQLNQTDKIIARSHRKEEIKKQESPSPSIAQSKMFMQKQQLKRSKINVLNPPANNISKEKIKSTDKYEDKHLSICDMDLDKTFALFVASTQQRVRGKENTARLPVKKNTQLPKLRKMTSPRQESLGNSNLLLQKLIPAQEKPSLCTLELSYCSKKASPVKKVNRSNHVKNVEKIKKKHQGKHTDRLSQVVSTHIVHKKQSVYKFPVLKNTSQKKHQKNQESFLLQRMMLDRKELPGSSSVINLSLSSPDEYKHRFLRRKQQFLQLIQSNINQSIIS